MKRRSLIILDILTVLSCAGAYAVDYLIKRKLGFVRWLNYNEAKILQAYPADKILTIAAIVMAALLILIIVISVRRRAGAFDKMMLIVPAALTAGFIYILIGNDTSSMRAYYLILICLGIGTLLQMIRALIAAARSGRIQATQGKHDKVMHG